jgi:hypothetical protein
MLTLGSEPTGIVIRRAEVFAWLPGLTRSQWKKIHPALRRVYVPGGYAPAYAGQRPHYYKVDVKARLIRPIAEADQAGDQSTHFSQSKI